MLKEGTRLQCERVIVWNWLSELSWSIQDEMRNKMIYVESVGLCRKIVSREQYREWCVCERVIGMHVGVNVWKSINVYKCTDVSEGVCKGVMKEHTYIYAWNWLYVMDYYKCMLRECGDRIINMHIQDSKGVWVN